MTRPRNHVIERVDNQPLWLKATWEFTDSEFQWTNRNFQVYARSADTGNVYRSYTVPEADGCWTDNADQKRDEGYVITDGRFYPYTREVLVFVQHHVQMVGHNGYDDGVTDVQTFEYAEPLPPNITLTRDGRKLSWEIDSRISDMPDTSRHYRTKTCFVLQTYKEGDPKGWTPSLSKYPQNGYRFSGEFTGEKQSYSRNDIAESLSLEPGTRFRLAAVNMGPSGCSDIGYSEEHVYSMVNQPVITGTDIFNNPNRVKFYINHNINAFHPIDAVVLERGEGVSTRPDASDISYSTTIGEEKRSDIGTSRIVMWDTLANQIPAEDKAMYYRAKTYHDSSSENIAYGYAANPVRGGNPKAPTDVEVQPGNSTTVTFKTTSACNPGYIVTLHINYRINGVISAKEYTSPRISFPGSTGEKQYVFENVKTSGVDTISSVWATVQAVKEWGGLAGTTKSEVVKSDETIIPFVDEIRLLEDGVSLYVSETHENDDWDSTEYSWHTRIDGWESNEKPETYTVDSSTTESHLIITKLDDGVEYFVRCRRYNSSTKAYGLYSSIVSTVTGSVPGTPVLSANASVAAGRAIEYSWDFQGATQTEARLAITPYLKQEDSYSIPSMTEYDLEHIPDTTPTVSVDRQVLPETAFTINGSKVILNNAPAADASVSITYTFEEESVIENFTVSDPSDFQVLELEQLPTNTPTVTIDGEITTGYSISGTTVTLDTIPSDGVIVRVSYLAKMAVIDVEIDNSDQGYIFETDPSWEGRLEASVSITCGGKWSAMSSDPIYRKTTDQSIDSSKTYYTRTGEPGAFVYTPVANPVVADISNYYEQYPGQNVSTEVRQPPICTIAPAGTLQTGGYSKTTDTYILTGKVYYILDGGQYVPVDNPVVEDIDDYYEKNDYYRGYLLTALPLTVDLGGTGDKWELTLTTANRTNEPTPAGDDIVPSGSVVWTSTSSMHGTVDLITKPGTIVTGGQYDLKCVCIDSATGARSKEVSIGFTANWARKAVEPVISVSIERNPETNAREAHVTAHRGAGDTDSTLTLWRYTTDGAISCVDNAGDDVEYTDTVPPYQWDRCSYIAQVTTPDGDIQWTRAEYELPGFGVTINFDNREVVLPFNIGFDDDYTNEFESRAHMDGHRSGYWEPGVDRKGKGSGQLPLEQYEDTVMLLRQLGRYAGMAFVRDIRGVAFPCHVDVSMSNSYDAVVYDVDLSITEVSDDGTWNMTSGAVEKEEGQ